MLEKRESVTKGFEKSRNKKIILFKNKNTPNVFDSIRLKSRYLKKNNMLNEIIAFRISGIDQNENVVFSNKHIGSNIIPKEFNQKLNECIECKSIKVDAIMLKWFTGTYGLSISEIWNLK